MSSRDYPEHLNPFDENYDGVVEPPCHSRHKYNTWSASRPNMTLAKTKPKPTFLEKPWAALNISPKGKIVRRLSILKSAVERFTSKKRLSHSSSYTEGSLPPRSHSVHDDYTFRIISPKLKEKLRQQAFSRPVHKLDQTETSCESTDSPSSPQPNGRLALPLKSEAEETLKQEDASPSSPEPGREFNRLGARPKTRKKRPPPPPPTEMSKTANLDLSHGIERTEDSHSVNSSITQDLEKDASSEDDNSSTELTQQIQPSHKAD